MTVVCDYCCVYIEDDNRRWPGYCSPGCRDRARAKAAEENARRIRRQGDPEPRWVTQ